VHPLVPSSIARPIVKRPDLAAIRATAKVVISPRQGAQHGEERSSRAGRVPCVEIQLSTLPGLKVRARCVCEAPSEEWSASSTLD